MRLRHGLVLALTAAAVFPAPAHALTLDRIVLQSSIGPFKLGMSERALKAVAPTFERESPAGCDGYVAGFTVCVGGATRGRPTVDYIASHTGLSALRRYRTSAGIGIGSTRSALARAYPEMRCYRQSPVGAKRIVRFAAREITQSGRTPWACKAGMLLAGASGALSRECIDTQFGFDSGRSARVTYIAMSRELRYVRGAADDCRDWYPVPARAMQ